MKRSLIVFGLCFSILPFLNAQQTQKLPQELAEIQQRQQSLVPLQPDMVLTDRLLLAISSKNYPVTPGDVYRISFVLGGEIVSNEVLVESDYTLNLNIFGKIDAKNLSFSALKPIVEKKITTAYPRSMPFLNIVSVGIFNVLIKGEVPQTTYVTAWGLSRLSSVIKDNLGTYSSIRDIGIISGDGTLKKYDLFKALALGIVEEDPYIQPGDSIIINRRDREVELKGEVFRPGKYQLLKGQGLSEVIEIYGRGLTNLADTGRVRLDRFADKQAQTLYLNLAKGIQPSMEVKDGDVLTVPAKSANLPVVFFEGAIIAPETAQVVVQQAEAVGVESYNRLTHPFIEGESLLDAFLAVKDSVSATGDLSNVRLIRSGSTPIPVNLERLMYNYDPSSDIALQPFDRIIIPALWFNVSIVGAVNQPGVYPFVPNKTYAYYLGLAGGLPPGQPSEFVSVIDVNNNKHDLEEHIRPGDSIIVAASLIAVSGAVYAPGSYPFIPGKSYHYYVQLAGGFDPERNRDEKVSVIDAQGKSVNPAAAIIKPGDRIFVRTNDFTYNFNRYFPIITAGISLITAVITVVDALAK